MNYIVRIPEPCHEDWNQMKPDEKGRFCNVCSKSVFDFSDKTDEYIHSVLAENRDKQVCGHFRKSQVDRPLQIKIPFTHLSGRINRMNVFAVALFFVFGTFLFSCSGDNGRTVGEIGLLNMPDQQEDAMMRGLSLPSASADTPNVERNTEMPGGPIMNILDHVNGGISYDPPPLIEGKMVIEEVIEPIIEPVQVIDPEPVIAGGISYQDIYINEPVIEHVEETTDSVTNKTINPSTEQGLQVFPNPTNGEFHISYEVKQKGTVQADIYDMNGSLVRSIIRSQTQHTGKYIMPVNLSGLAAGIYICKVIINGKAQHEEVVITK